MSEVIGSWEILMEFYVHNYQADFKYWCLGYLSWNFPLWTSMEFIDVKSTLVLMMADNEPFSETLLTHICVAIRRHYHELKT